MLVLSHEINKSHLFMQLHLKAFLYSNSHHSSRSFFGLVTVQIQQASHTLEGEQVEK